MSAESIISELRAAIETHQHPQIMTPQQAADFLGVSDYYLLDLRKKGAGPTYSQPGSKIVRYQRDDLVAWLNENLVTAK
ncbi:helix-turn-helix transcriptional regulator [Ruegeria sp.]|uniref:helix-turn-helix transcriptional regulator n=1 Tax=Ruegeria sp. TaxID=1879320 RepID=UPI003C7A77DD